MPAAVQRHPQTEFGAEEENIGRERVFFNDMGVAAHATIWRDYRRPGLTVVGGLVGMRRHIAECVPIERGISCRWIVNTCLDPRHPREPRQVWNIGDDI